MALEEPLRRRATAASFDETETFGEAPARPPTARRGDGQKEPMAEGKSDAEVTELARSAGQAAMTQM